MRESLSRLLLGIEMLPVLPCAALILIMMVPAAVMLIPIGLIGLGATLVKAAPGLLADLWTGAGVLLMGVLGACATVAVFCLLMLAVMFLLGGRDALRRSRRLLRVGVVCGVPPLLLSSLPRVVEALLAAPFELDRVAAAVVYGGMPLVIPAVHLLLEARRPRAG